MLKVGLTGGIGSGKSTAAGFFEAIGVPVLDADKISHELVKQGQPALDSITEHFGRKVLDTQGNLDRKQMRQLVFGNQKHRQALEAILHPRIRQEMKRQLARLNAPYCILSIPLLLESRQGRTVDRILVIDVPIELQYRRVRDRNGLTMSEITGILAAQLDRQARLAAADDVISNAGDLAALKTQVEMLHRQYLELAKTYH